MALVVKSSPANAGEAKFNPWDGTIPWKRKWQPLQYSCLGNPMDRGAWRKQLDWETEHTCTCVHTHTHTQTHTKEEHEVHMALCWVWMRSSYNCLERQRKALFSRLQQLPGDPWWTAVFSRSSCIKLCFIAALFVSKAVFDKALTTSVVSGRDDQRQRCWVQKKMLLPNLSSLGASTSLFR